MTVIDEDTVLTIDDDARMRAATQRLMKSVGLHAETFATPQDFLPCKLPEGPSCLVLDVRLPGMSRLDVQLRLIASGMLTKQIASTLGTTQITATVHRGR